MDKKKRSFTDMTGWVMAEHGVEGSRWTVISLDQEEEKIYSSGRKAKLRYWLCECSCEKHTRKVIEEHSLKFGGSRSCGCRSREWAIEMGHRNKKTTEFDLSGEVGVGYCRNTGTPFYFDKADFDLIKDLAFFEHEPRPGYHCPMANNYPQGAQKLWVFLGCKGYDHIDHNPFNNVRSNLRPCTQHQNTCNGKLGKNNTTGITGVQYCTVTPQKPWRARIMFNRKEIYLGCYATFEDAVKARLEAEQKYFGEFAPQKHLYAQYGIQSNETED
jgi:hypothetical protein